ncbi:cupredoxin domain-containing protein [Thiomonas sp.]|jgi:plastocyanin domain-containing protein|uniref:cupredoxin domain-containing protein n=1 Tax=Thiomonas sp. TaxID=2047785 RepID=UPI0026157C73|nr:cupredoxin domain-containing protein [Thiomonas sp.]
MQSSGILCGAATVLAVFMLPCAALAAEATPTLTIHAQAFQPGSITIAAGQRTKIVVDNKDALPAEFESNDFSVEQVIPGGTALPVYIPPLKPGSYTFFNDFHPSSTGTLIVRAR